MPEDEQNIRAEFRVRNVETTHSALFSSEATLPQNRFTLGCTIPTSLLFIYKFFLRIVPALVKPHSSFGIH